MVDILKYADASKFDTTLRGGSSPQGKSPEEMYSLMNQQQEAEEAHQEELNSHALDMGHTLLGFGVDAFEQESLIKAGYDKLVDWSEPYDPKYDPTSEIEKRAKDWSGPDKELLATAKNPQHLGMLYDRLRDQQEYAWQGEYFGGAGLAMQMGGIMLNPETWAFGAGEVRLLSKMALTGLKRIGVGATIGASSNLAQELALMANDTRRKNISLGMVAGAGAIFGGMGAMIPTRGNLSKIDLDDKMASDMAGAMKQDFGDSARLNRIPGDQAWDNAEATKMWSDAKTSGYAAYDEVDDSWTVLGKDGKTTTTFKGGYAEAMAKRHHASINGMSFAQQSKKAAKAAKSGYSEPVHYRTDDEFQQASTDLDKLIPRIKAAWLRPLKSIGSEGMNQKNPWLRKLVDLGVAFAPGTGGKKVARHSAAEDAVRMHQAAASTQHVAMSQAFNQWKKTHVKGIHGPASNAGIDEFYKQVVWERAFRRYPDSRVTGAAIDPSVKKAADAVESAERMRIGWLKDNAVEGYENLQFNKTHISHRWSPQNLIAAKDSIGAEAVIKLLSRAIRAGDEFKDGSKYAGIELTEEFMAKTSNYMADAIFTRFTKRPELADVAKSSMFTKVERKEIQERAAEAIGDPATLKHVMAAMDGKDSHVFNEVAKQIKMDITTKVDGMSVVDLLNTDLGATSDSIFRRDAGRAAWARKGYKSSGDFLDDIQNAGKWEGLNNPKLNVKATQMQAKKYQKLWGIVLGETMEEVPDGAIARHGRLFRGLAQLSSLNQVGIVQASEVGRLASALGVRTFLETIPEIPNMIRSMKNGKFKSAMLNDIEAVANTRLGDGHLLNDPRLLSESGGHGIAAADSGLLMRGLDAAIPRLKHVQGYVNGMNMVMRAQQRMHAQGWFSRLHRELAGGIENLSEARIARYADQGLGKKDLADIWGEMRKHSVTGKGWYGQTKVDNLHLVKFDPEVSRKALLAFYKNQGQAIQKNMPGETPWFMEDTLGKMLTQFRTFPIVAMEKQTIHDLKHFDFEAFAATTFTLGAATMAYMGKTYANSFGMSQQKRKKYLANRLTPSKIAAGALQYTGTAGWMPEAFAVGGNAFGIGNPFMYSETKGGAWRDALYQARAPGDLELGEIGGPGASYLNSAWRASTGLGRDIMSGEGLSKSTFYHATRLQPYSNAFGFKQLHNYIGRNFE